MSGAGIPLVPASGKTGAVVAPLRGPSASPFVPPSLRMARAFCRRVMRAARRAPLSMTGLITPQRYPALRAGFEGFSDWGAEEIAMRTG